MSVVWVGGKPTVTKVSAENRKAYKHVEGEHEVLIAGHSEYVGTYAQCVQFRDECVDPTEDVYEIRPYFDQAAWAA